VLKKTEHGGKLEKATK